MIPLEIRINNSIFESAIEKTTGAIKISIGDLPCTESEYLEGCIQFFSDQDSSDGYIKCADLKKIRESLTPNLVHN